MVRKDAMKLKRVIFVLAALVLLAAPIAATGQPTIPHPTPESSTVPAQGPQHAGGEASLVLPDMSQVSFGGLSARALLMGGSASASSDWRSATPCPRRFGSFRCTGRCSRSPT